MGNIHTHEIQSDCQFNNFMTCDFVPQNWERRHKLTDRPSYLESHSKNILRVSRPAENRHADDVLPEVNGAVSVLKKRTR